MTGNFSDEDVLTVATALLNSPLTEVDTDRCSFHHYDISCNHCSASVSVNWQEAEAAVALNIFGYIEGRLHN